MRIAIVILLIFFGLYLVNKICLWAEDRGYLYYRRKKPEGGAMGSALLELQGMLNPSARHIIEMKQSAVKHIRRESDAPGDLKNDIN